MIIRELLFGSRRYTDILRGTPGLGTNLLALRLKELEAANLIEQRRLPPPAASSVYELTEYGRTTLTPIIRALTNLGVDFLRYPPDADQFVPASSTMGALSKFFKRELTSGYSGAAECHTEHDLFHCAIESGELTALGFGAWPQANLVFLAETAVYMGLIVGYITVADALANGNLAIHKGSTTEAAAFFAQFEADFAPL